MASQKKSGSPFVVIVLLNYSRWRETVGCIRSLERCSYANSQILIIDNGSPDDSEQMLRDSLPQYRILQTGSNLGYTGGINFSLREARKMGPEYILVLNNDTEVEPDFLDQLIDAMRMNPSAACAGGTIYCFHDKSRVWYAGGELIRWRGLAVHSEKGRRLDRSLLGENRCVTFVTGCMILFRSSCLDAIGPEDERFFMYLDDIELSHRIGAKGYPLLYVPRSIIYHKVEDEEESTFKLYYSARNRLLLIALMNSGLVRLVSQGYFLCVIALKVAWWAIAKPRFYEAAIAGLSDFLRRRFGQARGFEFR
jgi:GT2 family glycosyltransferase